MKKATPFSEACDFLSAYLAIEHAGYTTQDVVAGIARLEAILDTGDAERAKGLIARVRRQLKGVPDDEKAT
jgi:hypothetical protein